MSSTPLRRDMSVDDGNPESDGEAWQDLDRDEQDRLLRERMTQGGEGAADAKIDQGETDISADEAESAIDLINEAMEETWTAEVMEDKEVGPIPVEMYEPAESQIRKIKEFTKLYLQVQAVGKVEDINEDMMEELDAADQNLNKLLGGDPEAEAGSPLHRGIVAEEGMDFAYFTDPDNYPSQLRMELYGALFGRYKAQMGEVASFLTE